MKFIKNRRLLAIGIIVASLVAVLVPSQAVMAAKTATVTINVTVGRLAITVDNTTFSAWTLVAQDEIRYVTGAGANSLTAPASFATGLTDGDCYWTLTNAGAVACDIDGTMTNLTGGTQWTIDASAVGTDQYMLGFAASGASSWTYLSTSNTANLVANLATSGTKKFTMQFKAPSEMSDNTAKSGTLTFTATVVA
ncbi:MAG: hypothetical protein AB1597_09400 [Chloroflexota bacterium]